MGSILRFTLDISKTWAMKANGRVVPVIGWAVVGENQIEPVVYGHECSAETMTQFNEYEGGNHLLGDLHIVSVDEWMAAYRDART
jgi:hypothetical protein